MVMLKNIPDLESFETVLSQLFKIVDESPNGVFDIHSVGVEIGLKEEEIDAMNLHLKRSNMIESEGGYTARISIYGEMIKKGQIREGFVPL